MSNIANNTIALTILQQGRQSATITATDTILDIASGAAKAAKEMKAAGTEAEAGISSVQSAADLSTLGRIVTATTLASAPTEAAASSETAADDWESALGTAYGHAYSMISIAIGVNGKFHLKEEIDLDELLGKIETIRTEKMAGGMSETDANKWADMMIYRAPGDKRIVEMQNFERIYTSEGYQNQLSTRESRLGVGKVLSTDEAGHVRVGAFEMKDASGALLVSLDDEGTLTTYNRDGSERSRQTKADLLNRMTGYVLDAKRAGVDLQTANFY